MKYNYRYILLFLVVIFTSNLQSVNAQISTGDQLVIHTNQAYYITGDVMSYKVYLPIVFKDKQKAIRACFLNRNGNLIHESFLTITDKNTASNSFTIPVDLSSGIYHMILSSYHKESDREIILSEVFVPVYADLKNDLKNLQEASSYESETISNNSINIDITLPDVKLSTGNSVNGEIQVNDIYGNSVKTNLSVTILDNAQVINGYTSVHAFPSVDQEIVNGLSEEIYLNGLILEQTGNDKKKFPVIAIYASGENKFSYVQTDNEGAFSFTMPDFDGTKSVQFINYDEEQINIKINTPEISKNAPKLIVTEEILSYLDWSRKRRKIEQVFDIAPPEIKESQTTWTKSEVKKAQDYDIDNYESFEDISTLFTEVISPLRIKKLDDGSYKAQVFNRKDGFRGFFEGTPIFIIDGLVTKDANYVNGLDLNLIKTISIVADLPTLRKSYGPIGQSGVIYINTMLPEVRLPNNEMDNIIKLNGYRSAEMAIPSKSNDKSIPNFDSNIYWAPQLETNENGTLNFQFTHTDDRGEFIIEVVAHDKDGQIFKSTMIYNVAN